MRRSFFVVAALALCVSAPLGAQSSKPDVSFEEKLLATTPDDLQREIVVFAPDGRAVVYSAWDRKNVHLVVLGDKRSEGFEKVSNPVFSPDGKTVAFWAEKDKKGFMVVGDQKGEEFDGMGLPTFSPDGKTVGYEACNGSQHFVVVGGSKSEAFVAAWPPVFSPDGKPVAYGAEKGQKWFVACLSG